MSLLSSNLLVWCGKRRTFRAGQNSKNSLYFIIRCVFEHFIDTQNCYSRARSRPHIRTGLHITDGQQFSRNWKRECIEFGSRQFVRTADEELFHAHQTRSNINLSPSRIYSRPKRNQKSKLRIAWPRSRSIQESRVYLFPVSCLRHEQNTSGTAKIREIKRSSERLLFIRME